MVFFIVFLIILLNLFYLILLFFRLVLIPEILGFLAYRKPGDIFVHETGPDIGLDLRVLRGRTELNIGDVVEVVPEVVNLLQMSLEIVLFVVEVLAVKSADVAPVHLVLLDSDVLLPE